jgi:GxxExxY protein
MSAPKLQHSDITELIIKGFYQVYNELGYGFLEKAYENAMVIALRDSGLTVAQQSPINVFFRGEVIGKYESDLVVNDLVIVELKAVRTLSPDHEAQLLNYLKAAVYEVDLLLNFGAKAEFKRKAFDNGRKGSLSWSKAI